jgi:hypothetical protein
VTATDKEVIETGVEDLRNINKFRFHRANTTMGRLIMRKAVEWFAGDHADTGCVYRMRIVEQLVMWCEADVQLRREMRQFGMWPFLYGDVYKGVFEEVSGGRGPSHVANMMAGMQAVLKWVLAHTPSNINVASVRVWVRMVKKQTEEWRRMQKGMADARKTRKWARMRRVSAEEAGRALVAAANFLVDCLAVYPPVEWLEQHFWRVQGAMFLLLLIGCGGVLRKENVLELQLGKHVQYDQSSGEITLHPGMFKNRGDWVQQNLGNPVYELPFRIGMCLWHYMSVFLLGTAHITTQAARLHLFRNSRGGKLTTLQARQRWDMMGHYVGVDVKVHHWRHIVSTLHVLEGRGNAEMADVAAANLHSRQSQATHYVLVKEAHVAYRNLRPDFTNGKCLNTALFANNSRCARQELYAEEENGCGLDVAWDEVKEMLASGCGSYQPGSGDEQCLGELAELEPRDSLEESSEEEGAGRCEATSRITVTYYEAPQRDSGGQDGTDEERSTSDEGTAEYEIGGQQVLEDTAMEFDQPEVGAGVFLSDGTESSSVGGQQVSEDTSFELDQPVVGAGLSLSDGTDGSSVEDVVANLLYMREEGNEAREDGCPVQEERNGEGEVQERDGDEVGTEGSADDGMFHIDEVIDWEIRQGRHTYFAVKFRGFDEEEWVHWKQLAKVRKHNWLTYMHYELAEFLKKHRDILPKGTFGDVLQKNARVLNDVAEGLGDALQGYI